MTNVKNLKQTTTSEHRRNQAQMHSREHKVATRNPKVSNHHRQTQRLKNHLHTNKRPHNDDNKTYDYSNRLIVKQHKRKITSTDSVQPHKVFTVQCIVEFLVNKYPGYKSYVDQALQYMDPDVIILNIREAEQHINHICKKMNLGFFQTMIVRNAVTSTLTDRGMPK